MWRRLIDWLLCLALITACSAAPPAPAMPSETLAAQDTPASAPAASPVILTSTPDAPTEQNPIVEGPTPLPSALPPLPETARILPANVSRLMELERWGKGVIQDLAWSLSGGQMAVATTTGVYIYNTRNFQNYQFLPATAVVASLDYRPTGNSLVAAVQDGSLLFIEGSDASISRKLLLPGPPSSVVYHPDGRRVAVSSLDPRFGVQIWNAPAGKLLYLLPGTATPETLAFNPSGGLLAAQFDGGVALWDTATGQRTALIRRPGTSYPTSLAFHPKENKIVIGSDYGLENSIDLYLTPRGGHLRILVGHKDAISAIAIRPDGREFASSSNDGTIQIWDWNDLDRLRMLSPQSSAGAFNALHLEYDPLGRRLAYAGRTSLLVWDSLTRQVVGSVDGHLAWDYATILSPDGSQLAASPDGRSIELWDVNLRQVLRRLDGAPPALSSLAFSSSGFLLAAGGDTGGTAVWDLLSGERLYLSAGEQDWAAAQPTFTPDGQSLVVANGSLLSVYHPRSGERLAVVDCEAVISALALSPDGTSIASAHLDGSIQLRRLPDLTLTGVLQSQAAWPSGQLAFSPDGRSLAAAEMPRTTQPGVQARPTLRLWDLSSNQAREFEPPSGEVTGLVFSPDGLLLAAAGGAPSFVVDLWDTSSGQKNASLTGHTLPLIDLVFSPDGELLVSASRDGTLRRWGIPQP